MEIYQIVVSILELYQNIVAGAIGAMLMVFASDYITIEIINLKALSLREKITYIFCGIIFSLIVDHTQILTMVFSIKLQQYQFFIHIALGCAWPLFIKKIIMIINEIFVKNKSLDDLNIN